MPKKKETKVPEPEVEELEEELEEEEEEAEEEEKEDSLEEMTQKFGWGIGKLCCLGLAILKKVWRSVATEKTLSLIHI